MIEIYNSKKKLMNIKFMLAGLITGIMLFFLPKEVLSPFLIIILGLFSGILLILYLNESNESNESNEYNYLLVIFIIAFLTRIFFALTIYIAVYKYKGTGLFGDGFCYSENGYSILKMWLGGIKSYQKIFSEVVSDSCSGTLGFYDFWNAIVYYFSGKNPISVIFINCLAGSLTVIIIYHLTKKIYNETAAKISAVLTAFWPSLFFWSIQNLKEPISILLITFSVWLLVYLKKKFRFSVIILIVISLLALKLFRNSLFFVFCGAVLPYYLLFAVNKSWKINFVIFVFLGIAVLFYYEPLVIAVKSFSRAPKNISFLEWFDYMRGVRAYGGSAFLQNWDISHPLAFLFFLPISFLITWFAPFPWHTDSFLQIIAQPEMLIYYLLIPAFFSGFKSILRDKNSMGKLIIVFILAVTLVLSLIEGNIGTLFRHRSFFLPFAFVLAGIGLERVLFLKNRNQIT